MTSKCPHGPNLLEKLTHENMVHQSSSEGVKEAATRVRGNGTTVSLHEVIPSQGFNATVGDTPHCMMRNGGVPFKIEGVEVERHHKEDSGKMM